MRSHNSDLSLLCRVKTRLYALPLAHVVETMRPLPIESIVGVSHFVRGLSIIRGSPTPVVDLAPLSDAEESHPKRFVTMAVGTRRIAVIVDSVLGVRSISADSLQALPPLLENMDPDVVSAIGTLDAELLLILSSTRLVPEDLWIEIESRRLSA